MIRHLLKYPTQAIQIQLIEIKGGVVGHSAHWVCADVTRPHASDMTDLYGDEYVPDADCSKYHILTRGIQLILFTSKFENYYLTPNVVSANPKFRVIITIHMLGYKMTFILLWLRNSK
ncbi:hypothetical protein ACTXT7_015797 [Hymenolepis weldensis]